MTKNKGGRPTKFTPETIAKLEEAFLLGCSDLEACLVANIAPSSLYNYQAENPKFLERKRTLKKNPSYKARKTVVEAIETDAKLAMEYLTKKERDDFASRQESTGVDGGPIDNKWTVEFVNATPESK